jgi:hypothetical protein
MNEDEVVRKLTKINQLMDKLIFAFRQTGMSLRHARKKSSGC